MKTLLIAMSLFSALLFAPATRAQGPGLYDCYCGPTDKPDDPECKFAESYQITCLPVPGDVACGLQYAQCDFKCDESGKKACKFEQKSSVLKEQEKEGFSKDLDCPPATYKFGTRCLKNPLQVTTFPELIGRIINTALGTLGSFALLMFIYGGFLWLTSGGSADKIGKGKDVMTWAGLGLILIFASFALVRFVLSALTKL